jgi:pimeloyl-ACP methyl ester carboxylesterase
MGVWCHQFDVVRQSGRPIIALDLPGHGASDDAANPALTYSFPGYAGTVSTVLDAFGIKSVDVVGWSLGGHIGFQLLAVDDRVRSLLVVGTPPAPLHPQSLETAFYASDRMSLAGKPIFTKADALAYGTAMMGGRNNLPDILLASIERTDGLAREFMFGNALRGIGVDQREVAEATEKPLCIVHGGLDPFVRLEYLRSLQCRALWQNRIFVFDGAGHAPHWSHPDMFNDTLSGFSTFVEYNH